MYATIAPARFASYYLPTAASPRSILIGRGLTGVKFVVAYMDAGFYIVDAYGIQDGALLGSASVRADDTPYGRDWRADFQGDNIAITNQLRDALDCAIREVAAWILDRA